MFPAGPICITERIARLAITLPRVSLSRNSARNGIVGVAVRGSIVELSITWRSSVMGLASRSSSNSASSRAPAVGCNSGGVLQVRATSANCSSVAFSERSFTSKADVRSNSSDAQTVAYSLARAPVAPLEDDDESPSKRRSSRDLPLLRSSLLWRQILRAQSSACSSSWRLVTETASLVTSVAMRSAMT